MNRNTLLTLAVLGVAAYFLLRKKPQAKEIGQAPSVDTGNKTVEGVDKGTKAETTATLKAKGVKVPKRKLLLVDEIKVPVKEPIYVSPVNLVPNIYDRGVGQPLMASGEAYYNMSGVCTEDIQKACKCQENKSKDYKLEIPSFL